MDTSPLVILAHVRHPAVTDGFLPAARRMGHPVVILTDHRHDHLRWFHDHPEHMPARIIECDVFNPLAAIDALRSAGIRPAAVFSNSDHLQTSTALVAEGFGLPGKDWRVCYAAKNKAATRERLRELGLPTPWFHSLVPGAQAPLDTPWPVVAKPREGVASMDVALCADAAALDRYLKAFWQRHPGRTVLLEAFMEGPLFTLETLGDGHAMEAIGGFDVTLSEPPHFIELEARWNGPAVTQGRDAAFAQVKAFGATFGICHSEFILTPQGPVLVEINYRSIGDGREFMLDRMHGGHWFETLLRPHFGERLALPERVRPHALVRYVVASREGWLVAAPQSGPTTGERWHADYRALRLQGDEIRLSHSNKDYLGILNIVADDDASLEDALATAHAPLHWDVADQLPGVAA
ncbi:carboxylate--amine ligase [Rothia nasimurium]|uniref:Siderophore biosynthesis protein PvsA n=1 Tax=Luteibacter anthropi TaxID=564369 RepID=A0A7X5ZHC3_9GAMM|nr:siderophore biosynthesis protein PvsA [Luteibacter anthropi]NII05420.1 siderophore biosynthesis protein PvsA [Luteibacter anthropi]